MSDKFFIPPIEQLFKRMVIEEKSGQLFGIPRSLFFTPSATDPFRSQRYGRMLETPIGVASGPHTQMTQNIISAWLTGARYIELKTVQTLDELNVTKPCIDLEDEGYNCEWSQELKLKQSYDQYLNAWILIHLLRHKWGWDSGETNELGCLFNMSVGYNMEGILNPNVQEFLNKMENCMLEKEEKLARLASLYPAVKELSIPDKISNHITLSTMHGCPPDEIEKIGLYLIETRGYHTTIKLNPTLLGPEPLREILNHKLGYTTPVPDQAFAHDLKYPDALSLIRSLQTAAAHKGVDFGLKLTNTLESVNFRKVFPPQEAMMYMSGRALHPISIQLAARLQREFNGTLDLSFSAGIDCFNVAPVIACGIRPVTVCSDILKPGGYGRLCQYLQKLSEAMKASDSINNYILNTYQNHFPNDQEAFLNMDLTSKIKTAALANLEHYAQHVVTEPRYKKTCVTGQTLEIKRELSSFDCIAAPCQSTCPAQQAIPDYMYYTATGNYSAALTTILKTNPFPNVTGMVCDHVCMTACTRINYDAPLQIREIKRFITEQVQDQPPLTPAPSLGITVAIIGAGPSGLACAFFLALQGVTVEVYEAKNVPGGMVSSAIPSFRLKEEDIRKDITRIEKLGVAIFYNRKIDKAMFKELRERCDFVYVAVGAQTATRLNIEGENLPQVVDALSFLAQVRRGETVKIGKRVAIIGGGNSAVDAARTVWRLVKGQGVHVVMLYRRSRAEMPADPYEIDALLEEGITIHELTNPVKITASSQGLTLTCWAMELGEPDESGRRRPVRITGSEFELHFDTVISAIGQQVVLDFLDEPMTRDHSSLRLTGISRIKNVFIGGDALHGAFNIITAVADGKKAADTMLNTLPTTLPKPVERHLALAEYQQKSATRLFGPQIEELPVTVRQNFETVILPLSECAAREEASRCLLCSDVCNVCVTVCPNRANFGYTVTPFTYNLQSASWQNNTMHIAEDSLFSIAQQYQVLNLADYCNECGNCATFCPTAGAPYKDKPKLCLTQAAFDAESNAFFIQINGNTPSIQRKHTPKDKQNPERIETLTMEPGYFLYQYPGVSVKLDLGSFRILDIVVTADSFQQVTLFSAAQMSVILRYVAPQLGYAIA